MSSSSSSTTTTSSMSTIKSSSKSFYKSHGGSGGGGSGGGGGGGDESTFQMPDDVKRVGYMKKLKSVSFLQNQTMKKKYFVLRDHNDSNMGSLSYFDSEKKFRHNNGQQPKRLIYLKDCFSINRKIDGKHKHAIALYTRDECFTTIVEDAEQQRQWLEALHALQNQTNDFRIGHGVHYEHVWQVNINRNGLGQTRNMNGTHRLCLTAHTLYIVKVDPLASEPPDVYEFPLISIRRCGHTTSTFFIELGRSSSIGPGDIWIQADDSAIAQNMHEVILAAMCSSKNHESDFGGPSQRPRSASTSDKPLTSRRPQSSLSTSSSHTNQSMIIFGGGGGGGGGPVYSSTTSSTTSVHQSSSNITSTTTGAAAQTTSMSSSDRVRCDSMPSSRSRTTSESDSLLLSSSHVVDSRHWTTPQHYGGGGGGSGSVGDNRLHLTLHSRTLSYSPPSHNPLSSAAYSTDSTGSSLSIDDYDSGSHCLTPVSEYHLSLHNSLMPSEPPISEEDGQTDDYLSMSPTGSSSGGCGGSCQSMGVRSHLNLNFYPTSNPSPITSPTTAAIIGGSATKSLINSKVIDEPDSSPYIPMSPVGSVETSDSLVSSRRSSGLLDSRHLYTNENIAEYMPMVCTTSITTRSSSQEMIIKSESIDEYLNMAPLSESLPKINDRSAPPPPQPKEEFHLDKVKSYFPHTDDELDSFDYILPVRAYSIGSRPSQPTATTKALIRANIKSRQQQQQQMTSASSSSAAIKSGTQTPEENEIRIRAFSMGSHVTNMREMRIAAKRQALVDTQIGGPTAAIDESMKRNLPKASSAPILSPAQPRKRSATVGCRPIFAKSSLIAGRGVGGSGGGGGSGFGAIGGSRNIDTDLMEIDYSSKSMQSSTQQQQMKERLEDRIKRSSIGGGSGGHRQRSNSRSSTSSSGIGSASTTSPSITSSMNELTTGGLLDRKSTNNLINRSIDDQQFQRTKEIVNNDYIEVHMITTNHELKQLPSSLHSTANLRPTITDHSIQLSQQQQQTIATVPSFTSSHSSDSLSQQQLQSHWKTNPIKSMTKTSESFAQTMNENNIKTKQQSDVVVVADSSDGDYVCLDMRSTTTTHVPQRSTITTTTTTTTAEPSSLLSQVMESTVVEESSSLSSSSSSSDTTNRSRGKAKQRNSSIDSHITTTTIGKQQEPQQQLPVPTNSDTNNLTKTSDRQQQQQQVINRLDDNNKLMTTNTSSSSCCSNDEPKTTISSSSSSPPRRSSPPSLSTTISSDKELNYASLDLATATTTTTTTDEVSAAAAAKYGSHLSSSSGLTATLTITTPLSLSSSSSSSLSSTSLTTTTTTAMLTQCCGSQEQLLYSGGVGGGIVGGDQSSNQLAYAEIDFGIAGGGGVANTKIAKS
ncbi:serine-rich adhesin for platelets-like isoform X2 [Oppia nitens]|uniref:serine-rich adhesin for platelets-like isoform X2 n=1 Tax=Oppia nitens TaxID=1686743 RepID=UPI0023D980D7|nr:serine-rich adhesin for platelets-like isoform X2 [Oppia nitens]